MQETRTRTYRGATTQSVQDSFVADAASAAGQGFIPADQRWTGQNELVVIYARQGTPAAPGPQRGLALLGSVLLGVVVSLVVYFVVSLVVTLGLGSLLGRVPDIALISLLAGPVAGAVVAVRRSRRSGWVWFIVMFVAVSAIWLVGVLALVLAVYAAIWGSLWGG